MTMLLLVGRLDPSLGQVKGCKTCHNKSAKLWSDTNRSNYLTQL